MPYRFSFLLGILQTGFRENFSSSASSLLCTLYPFANNVRLQIFQLLEDFIWPSISVTNGLTYGVYRSESREASGGLMLVDFSGWEQSRIADVRDLSRT